MEVSGIEPHRTKPQEPIQDNGFIEFMYHLNVTLPPRMSIKSMLFWTERKQHIARHGPMGGIPVSLRY